MKVTYSLSNNVLMLDDEKIILTYGIVARDPLNDEVLAYFDDVSVSRSLTQKITDILNSCEVELCHFREVVIDELNR